MSNYVTEYESGLVRYKIDEPVEPPEPKLTQLRNMGASGESYHTDGKNFYKQPRQDDVEDFTAHLHSEPAAAKAMQFMGAGDMIHPSEHVAVKGVSYLKSPMLHNPIKLVSHQLHDTLPDSSLPSKSQLSRYALASWVIHSMDRHDGNYVTHEDQSAETPIIKALDFGETFHPHMGFGERHPRDMHPTADSLISHLLPRESLPLDKQQMSHILSNKKALLEFAKEGTKGLTPAKQKEAKHLMQEKFTHLHSLMLENAPTIHHLPYYNGFDYQE